LQIRLIFLLETRGVFHELPQRLLGCTLLLLLLLLLLMLLLLQFLHAEFPNLDNSSSSHSSIRTYNLASPN
jgi:hypothetical protein